MSIGKNEYGVIEYRPSPTMKRKIIMAAAEDPDNRIPTTKVAKLIRAALKEEFPTAKFSVRSHSYSMGSSITIYWTDGPVDEYATGPLHTDHGVKEVRPIARYFAGATFDGRDDSKHYHDTVVGNASVAFGVDFVFTDRTLSGEATARAELEFRRENKALIEELGTGIHSDIAHTWVLPPVKDTLLYAGSYAMAVRAAGLRMAFGPDFDRSEFSLTMEESLTAK
jgi:hypothetical protein